MREPAEADFRQWRCRRGGLDARPLSTSNGTQVKIFALYDKEWAYATRLVDIALMVADSTS